MNVAGTTANGVPAEARAGRFTALHRCSLPYFAVSCNGIACWRILSPGQLAGSIACMAGSWGRAVRQLTVRQVRNGRVPQPSRPAEVRWFSCFAAFRRPVDLAGGCQLPALTEGVKVES